MASSSVDRQSMQPYRDDPIEMKSSAKVTEPTSPGSDNDIHQHGYSDIWNDTSNDVRDMQRLGKQQEFKRNFHTLSALGFVSVYMATWEFVLVSLSIGFTNGGFAGLFWCFITTVCCYATIVASLAEMESMAPTSGGQYHWVSEFSPPEYQKIFSYASGWMSTLGWLASVASSVYVCATQIQAIINVTRPDYAFTNWQITLIMLALTAVTIGFNTWGTPFFPQLEIGSLIGHIAGFFVVLIPLWALCEKNTASEVFTSFTDQSGFNNMGAAYLTCQVYVMYCNLGSDSVVHISEEVGNASLVVPRAMWWSYVGNVLAGIVMLITMLFCIGPLDPVVRPHEAQLQMSTDLMVSQIKSGVPYLLLFDRTGSKGLSLALNIILFLLIYLGNITALATAAREMFAFARDRGLPFSKWVGKMNRKWSIPFNAVYTVSVICGILCLVQLGSTIAFNIIVSLSVLGLLSTYMISIGCVLLRRIKGQPLPHARWSLGRYGIYINAFGFLYSAFIVVMACFPTFLPVDLASANWAPLVWVGVMILSGVVYLVHGKWHYTPPVEFVEGRKLEGVGLQTS
ncbi:uncharacterized protein LTR77_006475 [Saxophila tyrrhenica]|uniref:Amino acid transporter n=1 Tax=Saxophila tyrrhenica TaxID=1690608 RepID=A0AAV9P870_9PEZI|nr:hypothetical protein LTR77_006475 [Saxophila tyrrhenica]